MLLNRPYHSLRQQISLPIDTFNRMLKRSRIETYYISRLSFRVPPVCKRNRVKNIYKQAIFYLLIVHSVLCITRFLIRNNDLFFILIFVISRLQHNNIGCITATAFTLRSTSQLLNHIHAHLYNLQRWALWLGNKNSSPE